MSQNDHEPECECCAAGGPTPEYWEKFFKNVKDNIEHYGQAVQGVVGQMGTRDAFMYTIGNHEKNLPELLLIGWVTDAMQLALNRLGALQRKNGKPFKDGELVDIDFSFPVKVINATTEETLNEFTCQVENYYRTRDYAVQQVLFPDKNGKYPGEPGVTGSFATLPILRPN